MDAVNHQVRLAARPVGLPKPSDWSYTEEPVPEPGEGEVLVKILYISLDPAMRGWMNEGRSYIAPVGIGDVMRALAAGEVIASNHAGSWPSATTSPGCSGVQEYAVVGGHAVMKVDPGLAPLPVHLGTLGMPGMTAYFGLLDIGRPAEGETVVVSGAGGAVGGVAGQIAKLKGARTIGIAGGAEKCRYVVEELGFDAAIDYKSQDVAAGLRDAVSEGDRRVLRQRRRRDPRRRAGAPGPVRPRRDLRRDLPVQRHRRDDGSVQLHVAARQPRVHDRVRGLRLRRSLRRGRPARWPAGCRRARSRPREDIADGGIERFPETLLRLFEGENTGKLVLKVAEED